MSEHGTEQADMGLPGNCDKYRCIDADANHISRKYLNEKLFDAQINKQIKKKPGKMKSNMKIES